MMFSCHTFLGKFFLLVAFLYVNGTSRVQDVPGQNLTMKVWITDIYVQYYSNNYDNVNLRYFFRALSWYHNDNKLTPDN